MFRRTFWFFGRGDNHAPDYFIAFQCGFALQLFALAREPRPETGMDKAGVQRVREDSAQTLRQNPQILGASELEQLAAQMFGGRITHLRSVPVCLRIARWLRENFPELHALRRSAIDHELKQDLQAVNSARDCVAPGVVVNPILMAKRYPGRAEHARSGLPRSEPRAAAQVQCICHWRTVA